MIIVDKARAGMKPGVRQSRHDWCWLYGNADRCNQIINAVPEWSWYNFNRSINGAKQAYSEAGIENVQVVEPYPSSEAAHENGGR